MNRRQRIGLVVIVVSVGLMAAALLLSQGWSDDRPLHLYVIQDGLLGIYAIFTRWILAALVLPITIGVLMLLPVWSNSTD